MATLFQRLCGDIPEGGEKRIRVHAFMAALNEVRRGKMTGAEFVAAFELTPAQTNAAQTLGALLGAATNKSEFLIVLKDLLMLAECNVLRGAG